MQGRLKRLAATVTAALVLGAGTTVLTAGTASASQPVVIGDCSTTVKGEPGTPVQLSPSAVLTPVTNAIRAIPLLGGTLAKTVGGTLKALPPIPLGSIPTGNGFVTGGQIANNVIGKLGPLGVALGAVQHVLTKVCGVTMHGVNAASAPIQNGTGALADQSQRMFSPNGTNGSKGDTSGGGDSNSPGGTSSGGSGDAGGNGNSVPDPALGFPTVKEVHGGIPYTGAALSSLGLAPPPSARYGDVPFATPGVFSPSPGVRYGGAVPGYSPQFGTLGGDRSSAGKGGDPVRTAGSAEAIGGAQAPGSGGVGLALLFAVLALAGVTAALVRTWVLRTLRRQG